MKFIRKKVEAHFLDACMRREKTLLLFMIQSSCDWDFAKINVKNKEIGDDVMQRISRLECLTRQIRILSRELKNGIFITPFAKFNTRMLP